ncbi:alpha/beta fold hydrolase [Paenibacillus sp. ACRRX]|uniref:alpha/beta fold hydrolase n=1 Tax=Paenibacillus sp. ACRRX TaxID=2918206 RepID=UPI001EF4D34F|nr:alpha/beta fold hydrolase [Paenibacillus sp. ACRRX]MCG7407079.1 alpha/beta fold hydrolase [Paenibacillus sp. ACRRX]
MRDTEQFAVMSELMEKVNQHLLKLLYGQLQSMGCLTDSSAEDTDLPVHSKIPSFYRKWLEESRAFLEGNVSEIHDIEKHVAANHFSIDMQELWKSLDELKLAWIDAPRLKTAIEAAERMLRALPDIWAGNKSARDILVADWSVEQVEVMPKINLFENFFAEVLAEVLIQHVKKYRDKNGERQIKIVEVGAGAGCANAAALRKLAPYFPAIQEYCYTDISETFLNQAIEQSGPPYPFLKYRMFNVENPVADQHLEAGGYDIVIVTNALHPVGNVRQSLRNVKALLRKNGLLILKEMTMNCLLTHLTFGLLEDWVLYEDAEQRTLSCPFLSVESWQKVLKSEGFHSIYFSSDENVTSGQHIIAAQSDGVVRQIRQQHPAAGSSSVQRQQTTEDRERTIKPNIVYTPIQNAYDDLREKTNAYLKRLVSDVLLVPYEDIDENRSFDEYGLDSIIVIELTNLLHKGLKEASNTLFFEYPTIHSLSEHLITAQREAVVTLVGWTNNEGGTKPSPDTRLSAPSSSRDRHEKRSKRKQPIFVHGRVQHTNHMEDTEPGIAVIGLSGRYPGASNVLQFWKNLKHGQDCITEMPQDRINSELDANWANEIGDEAYQRLGGFLDGVDLFDPLFFNISPREADRMDPQERLFLQTVWETLEDAGYNRRPRSEQTGIFVGATSVNGNAASIANRVSHYFHFKGPSMALDTMCSSSLTAIHLACESIRQGECRMAIAGGVQLLVQPYTVVDRFLPGGAVTGEGVGAVLLKPLLQAEADGDRIYAVIKGCSVNHAGRTGGYAAGEAKDQAELITKTLNKAGVDPSSISYFETQGNGVSYGDLNEIKGMITAFGRQTKPPHCAIGSVKSNLGHLGAAAGIAGLTKVLLQLKYAELVPAIHTEKMDADFQFEGTPFYMQRESTKWQHNVYQEGEQKRELPLRAGINAIGIGGTNACLILEQYAAPIREDESISELQLIVLSGRSHGQLKEYAKRLALFLREERETYGMGSCLTDVAYTLQTKREEMEVRAALVVASSEQLIEKLLSFSNGIELQGVFTGNCRETTLELDLFDCVDGEDFVNKLVIGRQLPKIAKLWTRGVPISWELLQRHMEPSFISLPLYPFKEERYRISQQSMDHLLSKRMMPLHPMLDTIDSRSSLHEGIVYRKTLRSQDPLVQHYKVEGRCVLPKVALLEMALAAGAQIKKEGERFKLTNVTWFEPVVMDATEKIMYLKIREKNSVLHFEIYSRSDAESIVIHASGCYQFLFEPLQEISFSLEDWRAADAAPFDTAQFVNSYFSERDIHYGSYYQGITQLWTKKESALSLIAFDQGLQRLYQDDFHLGIWDCAVQTIMVLLRDNHQHPIRQILSVVEVEKVGPLSSRMYAYVKTSRSELIDIFLVNAHGQICLSLKGLVFSGAAGAETGDVSGSTVLEFPAWSTPVYVSKPKFGEEGLSGSITRIIRSEPLHIELFKTHWHQIKNGYPFSKSPASLTEIRALVEEGEDIQHLLLKTKSSKQVEVCLCGKQANETVVLFAGFGLTASQWYYQIKDWKSHYQLLIIHPPGVGLSEDNGDLSFAGISNTCSEVLEALNITTPVHVIGTSWGGMLAQAFARYFPQKVKSLVLVASLYEVKHIEKEQLKEIFKHDFDRNHKLEEFELIEQSEFVNPVLQKYIVIHQTNGFDTYNLLPYITVPTLIISGKIDQVADYNQANLLLSRIPNAKLVEINGGHGCNITHYEELNAVVQHYFADQRQLVSL